MGGELHVDIAKRLMFSFREIWPWTVILSSFQKKLSSKCLARLVVDCNTVVFFAMIWDAGIIRAKGLARASVKTESEEAREAREYPRFRRFAPSTSSEKKTTVLQSRLVGTSEKASERGKKRGRTGEGVGRRASHLPLVFFLRSLAFFARPH